MIKFYKNRDISYGIELYTKFYDDEYLNKNELSIAFWKYKICIELPSIIKPTINTETTYSYDSVLGCRYGIHTFEDVIFINYGIYNDYGWSKDSKFNSRQIIIHQNWKQYDFIRKTIYDKSYNILWQEHTYDASKNILSKEIESYDYVETMDVNHKFIFKFKDYDGELITAICHIEEREWHRGRKEFFWLKYFYKPDIRTSLAITYSSEVGRRKGSWKGGIIGTGIDFKKDEDITDVFKRHCSNNQLIFIE